MSEVTEDKAAIDYALRYGGMCRDCADTRVRGICDNSGMPCDPDVCRKVIAHALGAWRYGIKHGFVHDPLSARASSSRAETVTWESFADESYFGMWCVRRVGDTKFGEGFHVASKEEASALVSALSATPSSQGELVEAPKLPLLVVNGKFKYGDRVYKTKGSSWHGIVVGFYSTHMTQIGYCVESEREPGSVQLYPETALSSTKEG